jgi:hypothetical protein
MATDDDCGCDGSEEFASTALADLDENTPDLHPDPRGNTVRSWSGLIAPYGVPTGDGRSFAAQALTSRELPYGLKWQRTDSAGHTTSTVVGRVDSVHFGDDGVYGKGIVFDPDPTVLPRLAEDANEAYHLLQQKVIGPSVDLDAMEFHPLEDPDEFAAEGKRPPIEVTKGRISAVTLVPIPAFAEARPFALEDVDADAYAAETALTASGVRQGLEMLAVAADDHDWDLLGWLTNGDAEGALYADDTTTLFPVAEEIEGQLALVPGAVADAISILAFKSGEVDLPEGVKDTLRARLEDLAAACDLPTPPWVEAGLVAAAGGVRTVKPAAAFADPKLSRPTPLQLERLEDGQVRVYGHVADWRTCHIGYQDRCVTAPHSRTNYAHFHKGSVQTEGGTLATGKITLGGGHADTGLSFQAAARHYDDVSACVADVRAGEDKHGIWISGIVRGGVDQNQLDDLASSPLSGDWRRIGGNLEMIAALAVNTPGFPLPQAAEDATGAVSLIAAGMVVDPADDRMKSKFGKKAKRKPAMVEDTDKDGYSVQDVARAVFAEIRAEERAQQEDAVLAATLEAEFGALDQLELAQVAGVFE